MYRFLHLLSYYFNYFRNTTEYEFPVFNFYFFPYVVRIIVLTIVYIANTASTSQNKLSTLQISPRILRGINQTVSIDQENANPISSTPRGLRSPVEFLDRRPRWSTRGRPRSGRRRRTADLFARNGNGHGNVERLTEAFTPRLTFTRLWREGWTRISARLSSTRLDYRSPDRRARQTVQFSRANPPNFRSTPLVIHKLFSNESKGEINRLNIQSYVFVACWLRCLSKKVDGLQL